MMILPVPACTTQSSTNAAQGCGQRRTRTLREAKTTLRQDNLHGPSL